MDTLNKKVKIKGGSGGGLTPEQKAIVDSWELDGEQLKANIEIFK